MHIISSKASIDVLVDRWPRKLGTQHHTMQSHHLPSWVPDFSQPPCSSPLPIAQVHSFSASGNTIPSVTLCSAYRELKLEGIEFDNVDQVLLDCIEASEDGEELDTFRLITLPVLDSFVANTLSLQLARDDPRRRLDKSGSLWRTLVIDHGADNVTAAPLEYGDILHVLHQSALDDYDTMLNRLQPLVDAAVQLIRNITDTMNDRVLFTTASGFIGVASGRVQKGDIVAVPFGSSTPLAFRKISVEDKYLLVTDCYVDGIMYGELLRLVDTRKVKRASFVLT